MANPTNREELKQFCLRKLGKPVIEINVADEQLEDRIDDALKMYHDFHYDGIERVIIKHEISQDNIDNGFIELSDAVISIETILDLNTGSSSEILFDAEYHMTWDALYAFNSTPASLQHYSATKENINLINEMLNGKKPLRYDACTMYVGVTNQEPEIVPNPHSGILEHAGYSWIPIIDAVNSEKIKKFLQPAVDYAHELIIHHRDKQPF